MNRLCIQVCVINIRTFSSFIIPFSPRKVIFSIRNSSVCDKTLFFFFYHVRRFRYRSLFFVLCIYCVLMRFSGRLFYMNFLFWPRVVGAFLKRMRIVINEGAKAPNFFFVSSHLFVLFFFSLFFLSLFSKAYILAGILSKFYCIRVYYYLFFFMLLWLANFPQNHWTSFVASACGWYASGLIFGLHVFDSRNQF